LPYKIELNEWGQVVMSPASSRHSILQGLLIDALNRLKDDGLVFPECPIQTSKGVKVPDVVWVSSRFLSEHTDENPFSQAAEVCIEVLSHFNSLKEMEEKRELYFARGALEVWICDERGGLLFYDCKGQIPASRIFPGIRQIESKLLH
ncbi:MAG: Uma2 family endonuclease, partial [Methylococcaceae bacterium]|nr:Uma2 family endonuclease [Methylococcaceae bacterium]